MLYPFFEQAGRSVSRQWGFRQLLLVHQLTLGVMIGIIGLTRPPDVFSILTNTLIISGIVQGALLIGWRLAQWPKSQALELVLLSPVPAWQTMLGEQLIGLTQMFFLTLASLPFLLLLLPMGWLEPHMLLFPLVMQGTAGLLVGFGLVWWAYESIHFRRWGDRLLAVLLLFYFIIGGILGEKWLELVDNYLPKQWSRQLWTVLGFCYWNNPFALVTRMERSEPELFQRWVILELICLFLIILFIWRASMRLKAHYIERHYRPKEETKARPNELGNHPLSWWAVKRVHEYPGRGNLYVAGGAGIIYAIYLLYSNQWPSWMGTNVFKVIEGMGGVAGFLTLLVLLSAVPAAYQYGLWESSIPERCRRLEVFLMTKLSGPDYLHASWAASWARGRGYFAVALILGLAATFAKPPHYTPLQAIVVLFAAVALVLFYFGVGFRLLARNSGSASTGFLLTVFLPLITWSLGSTGNGHLAQLLPPGLVFYANAPSGLPVWITLPIILTYAGVGLWLIQQGIRHSDQELRDWYDANHGKL